MAIPHIAAGLAMVLLLSGSRCWRSVAQQVTLLLRCHLKHITNQQVRMVSHISLEASRKRTGEDPMIVLPAEQSRRHGGSRVNELGIGNPALGPRRAQPLLRQQEVRRDGVL